VPDYFYIQFSSDSHIVGTVERTATPAHIVGMRHFLERNTVPVGTLQNDLECHTDAMLPPLFMLQGRLPSQDASRELAQSFLAGSGSGAATVDVSSKVSSSAAFGSRNFDTLSSGRPSDGR
jgi:hypothetical protein